mmetsp:Transcript_160924/g.296390  ORF Transcript_160924/g.296390 Transcript_160924/m.296390 type:complete len:245 (+) Transcript_160924:64-798(+)
MYGLLEEVREAICERQALLKRRGNCHETIQKGHRIRQQLEELKRLLPKLQGLHKQAQKKRNASQRRDELAARYQDIRVLKRQVDEAQELWASANAGVEVSEALLAPPGGGMSGSPKATLFGGLRQAAQGGEDARRLLDSDEQEVMGQIKRRDQAVDKELDTIGNHAERLGGLALQIGVTAEQQAKKAEALGSDVDKNTKDLQAMNTRIAEVIRYDRNTTCCCQMILGVCLLCVLGVVFHQLNMG